MNPNEKIPEGSGITTARGPRSITEDRPETGDGMKRAAAKQMIEKYYYQLTDGCGNSMCENGDCASCPTFTFKDKTRNELAIKAIDLFKGKARLCGTQPSKVPRADDHPTSVGMVAGTGPSNAEEKASLCGALPSKVNQTDNNPPSVSATRTANVEEKPSSSKAPSTALFSQQSTCNVIKPIATSAAETINFLTEEKVLNLIETCKEEGSWSKLIRVIGSTFNNPDSLMMSFRKKNDTPSKDLQGSVSDEKDKSEKCPDKDSIQTKSLVDCDFSEGNLTIPVQETCGKTEYPIQETASECEEDIQDVNLDISLDLQSFRRTFKALLEIENLPYLGALVNALSSLSRSVGMELRYSKPLQQNPHYINIFLIVMEIPLMDQPEFMESSFPEFCKALGNMNVQGLAKLARLWSKFGAKRIREMVMSLQQLITVKIAQKDGSWIRLYQINDDEGITGATRVMKILYYASILGGEMDSESLIAEEKAANDSEDSLQNMFQGAVGHEPKDTQKPKEDPLAQELSISVIDCRKPLVAYDDFVNELLNEYIEIETDYKYKLESKFSFMNHSFILTTASKHTCMYFDNRVRMFQERRSSVLNMFLRGLPPTPFLRLRVRRDHLIDDALVNLEMTAMDNPQELKKQLFVEFEGEQALDEGGVSKEFFQLVIEEIFNPDIGMFTYNEKTRQFWFNPTSFENDGQFTLIGIMLGLAIYNSTIVDVHFPSVVYRKLVGKKGTFRDLQDVDPTLATSLQQLLDYDGEDMEDTFMQTFIVGYRDVFGSDLTHELKKNGKNVYVNQQNKQEFVDLYSDFILNTSIDKQFKAFKRGFQMVTNESPLRALFLPEEVEILICGSTHFDFHDLEKATDYDGGFTAESQTIKYFWETVHEFTEDQKRRLLQFTTGTDRVPVGGLSKIKLIIARNGPDSDRLPTAHTCFNVLLLPDYSTKEKLKDRLEKAVDYSKGFGML